MFFSFFDAARKLVYQRDFIKINASLFYTPDSSVVVVIVICVGKLNDSGSYET